MDVDSYSNRRGITERKQRKGRIKNFQVQPVHDLDTSKGPLTQDHSQNNVLALDQETSQPLQSLNRSKQNPSSMREIPQNSCQSDNYRIITQAIGQLDNLKRDILNDMAQNGSHTSPSKKDLVYPSQSKIQVANSFQQQYSSYQNTRQNYPSNLARQTLNQDDMRGNFQCSHSNPQLSINPQHYYETYNQPNIQDRGSNHQSAQKKKCPNCLYINETPQLNINISINIQNNAFNNQKDNYVGGLSQGIRSYQRSVDHTLDKNQQQEEDEEQKDEVHTIQSGYSPDVPKPQVSDNQITKFAQTESGQLFNLNCIMFDGPNNQNFQTENSLFQMPHLRQRSNSFYESNNAQRKWLKVKNVFKGVSLMRKNIVKTLQDPEEIVETINNSPRRKRNETFYSISSLNLTKCALEDVRTADRFFDLIQNGGQRQIPLLLMELENDPKKHFYDRKNSSHMINRINRMYQTPLYVACRNGNLSIVKWLLEQEADPHLLSNEEEKDKENILQVAARWHHVAVVEFLLNSVKWSKAEIKSVIRMKEKNDHISILLRIYSNAHFGCLFNFCICS